MHRFIEDATCAGGALEEQEAEIPIVFQLVGPSVRSSVGWMPRERAPWRSSLSCQQRVRV